MKKILFIGMSSTPGGIESFILNVFLNLKNKYDFDFVNTSKKPLAYSKIIRQNGGHIKHVYIQTRVNKYFTRYYCANKFFQSHNKYDIVDLNIPTINRIYWAKAALNNNIKNIIIHSHNCSSKESFIHNMFAKPMAYFNRIYLNKHQKNIYKLAASQSCGKWMFHSNKFKVVNNGIDPYPFLHNENIRKQFRNKLYLNADDKVVITTSRLEKQKNYKKIINVFNCIHKINKLSKLVIIGNGSEWNIIHKMVYNYKLNNDVYFLGQKTNKDIIKWLNIADMMLMPSLYEAVPFSLTEAQAAGVPALVSLDAIPSDANITGKVKYVSLSKSDMYWALIANKMLAKNYDPKIKIDMNKEVVESHFNLKYSIKLMNEIYSNIL